MTDRAEAHAPRRTRAVHVTALVVTHGPTEYLAETVAAVARQLRPPQDVLVVDVGDGEEDLTALVLEHWRAGGGTPEPLALVRTSGARTFGQAVARALAQHSSATGEPEPHGWLWLLHDDSAPEPDALAELLRAVEVAPSVAVAGCKQRTWAEPTRVIEVGVSASRFGRRMTGIDGSEVDQGQHDGRDDVLGVGIAGALVRRDVWTELRGTDPALGPYGDGPDLSRRARLAGHRVVVVPSAVVRHAQASLAQPVAGAVLNRPGWDLRRSVQARREAYLHSQLTGVPAPLVPVVVVLALVSGVLRGLMRLVTKEPQLVLAEVAAPWAVLLRPDRLVRARRNVARTSRLPRRSLRPLQVGWRDVARQARDRWLTASEVRRRRQAPSELELAELATLRSRRRAGLATVTVVAAALCVAALGPVLARVSAGADLVGGTLARGDADLGEVWSAAIAGRVPAGLGHPGPTDPVLLALAPLTGLTGTLGRASALVLLGAVLLGALGAWFAAGAATRSVALRAWAAVVWAGAPALLVAVGGARLGAVLAHVTLPWVVLGVARAVGVARADRVDSGLVGAQRRPSTVRAVAETRPSAEVPTGSLGAAAGAGLALAVVTAGAPVLLLPALVVLVAVALVVRRRRRLLWVALPSLAVAGPLVAEAVRTWQAGGWRLLLTDPGRPAPGDPAPAWQQLLGWPVAPPVLPDLPVDTVTVLLVASGVLLVPALAALLRAGGEGRAVRVGWFAAACGLGAAYLAAAVETGVASLPDLQSVLVTAWPGSGVTLVWAGLLAAALVGADGVRTRLAGHRFGWRQVLVAAMAVVCATGPALVLGTWTWQTRTAAGSTVLTTDELPVVPAVGRRMQVSDDRVRVLALEVRESTVGATLLRADGLQLTDTSRAVTAREVSGDPGQGVPTAPDDAEVELAEAAARLATGGDDAVAARVAGLGVGAVLVRPVDGDDAVGVRDRTRLVGRLDSTLGLERMTETEAGVIWRVAAADGTPTAWARLTDPAGGTAAPVPALDGRVATEVPAGAEGRLLLLAERADDGWHARLDGRPLRSVTVGWRQAFEVGEDGGELVVEHLPVDRTPWLVLQGVVVGATLLLALPVRRRRTVVS